MILWIGAALFAAAAIAAWGLHRRMSFGAPLSLRPVSLRAIRGLPAKELSRSDREASRNGFIKRMEFERRGPAGVSFWRAYNGSDHSVLFVVFRAAGRNAFAAHFELMSLLEDGAVLITRNARWLERFPPPASSRVMEDPALRSLDALERRHEERLQIERDRGRRTRPAESESMFGLLKRLHAAHMEQLVASGYLRPSPSGYRGTMKLLSYRASPSRTAPVPANPLPHS